jgi:hypothetical protein
MRGGNARATGNIARKIGTLDQPFFDGLIHVRESGWRKGSDEGRYCNERMEPWATECRLRGTCSGRAGR